MNWFWLDIPLALLFFLTWTLIPLWMVIRHPDTGPGPVGPGRPRPGAVRAGLGTGIPGGKRARRLPLAAGQGGPEPGIMPSMILTRPGPCGGHWLLGRLPSSYQELDAASDALFERVLDGAATDMPADVRHLAEQVRWAVRRLR